MLLVADLQVLLWFRDLCASTIKPGWLLGTRARLAFFGILAVLALVCRQRAGRDVAEAADDMHV